MMKGGFKMDTKIIVAIIVAGILLVGGYLYLNSGAEVSAFGTSNIKVTPDEVSVYLNAEANAESAQMAQAKQNVISDSILNELIKLGIDRKDIQTQSIQVYEDYSWESGKRTFKGYKASQQFVVKSDNFALTGQIVDSAVNAGALVSGINFELSQEKQNEYKKQALEEASKDARSKAKATAEGLGKGLGRLVEVQSQDFGYSPWAYYSNAQMDAVGNIEAQKAASNIVPSDRDVTASVSVRYKVSLF